MVEKQGVLPLRFTTGMARQEKLLAFKRATSDCSTEYMEHVTKGIRVEDALDAIAAVSAEPWARGIILAETAVSVFSVPV